MGGLEPRPNRLIEPICMEIRESDFGDGTIEVVKAYKGLSSSNLLEKIQTFLAHPISSLQKTSYVLRWMKPRFKYPCA